MNVTNNLKLPQYTEEDIFDLQDINKAYSNIDNAYKEVIDFKNEIPKTNATAEVIDARGGKETLGKRLDEFGSQLDNIVRLYLGDGSDLQHFIDNVAQKGGGTIKFVGKEYNITENLTFYIDLISFEGDKNTKLIFNHDKEYGVHLTTYNNVNEINQTLLHYKNAKNHIKGIEFRTSNDNLILVKSTSTMERLSSYWTIENCAFIGGDKGIYLHTRSWCNSIKNSYFRGSNYGIYMEGDGFDYGERINVNFCTFDNLKESGIYNANSSGEIWVGNCSIDYCIKHFAYVENGSIFINDSFIEGRCDGHYLDDHWFVVNKGLLKMTNNRLIVMSDKSKEIFIVPDIPHVFSYQAGLVVDTLHLFSNASLPKFLVKGNGRAIINNFLTTEDSTRTMFSEYMNKLSKNKSIINIPKNSSIKIDIPSNLDDTLMYIENTSKNEISLVRRYKDKDLEVIKEFDLLKDSLKTEQFVYEGYMPQQITYNNNGIFDDKTLNFDGSHIDWCSCYKEVKVEANKLYALISNIKVSNYVDGYCGSLTNCSESEILLRKTITGITNWTVTYDIIKPITNKTIRIMPLACVGSLKCSVSNVMFLDLSNTNLDWIVAIENTIKEIHGNTKSLTNKEVLTNRYYIPPQGTNYVEYEIINDNDIDVNIKCIIN